MSPRSEPRFPDFYVVGAVKSGTTSLYHYLAQHPEVYVSAVKEPQYFAWDLGNPDPTMSRQDYLALYRDADGRLTGDCSPQYFALPETPRRIHNVAPDARIVVVLRDPVTFLPSWFNQCRYAADETAATVLEGLDLEAVRAEGRWLPPGGHHRASPFYLRYRWWVDYPRHLRALLDTFPEDQVHVMILEEFIADRTAEFSRLLTFLGVDPDVTVDFSIHNAAKAWRPGRISDLVRAPPDSLRRATRWIPREAVRPVLTRLRQRQTVPVSSPPLTDEVRSVLVPLTRPVVSGTEAVLGRPLPVWHR